MATIKIAIVGIGNCVSSLLQGIEYYKDKKLLIFKGTEDFIRKYDWS